MPVVLQPIYGLDYYWDLKRDEQMDLNELTALPYDLSLNLNFTVTDPADACADACADAIPKGPWGLQGAKGCTGNIGHIAGEPIAEIDRRSEAEKQIERQINDTTEIINDIKEIIKKMTLKLDSLTQDLADARAYRHRNVSRKVTLSFHGVLPTRIAHELRYRLIDYVSVNVYTQKVRSDQPDPKIWRDNHNCSDDESLDGNSNTCDLCTLSDEDLIAEVDCHTYKDVVDPSQTKIDCRELPYHLWGRLISLLKA